MEPIPPSIRNFGSEQETPRHHCPISEGQHPEIATGVRSVSQFVYVLTPSHYVGGPATSSFIAYCPVKHPHSPCPCRGDRPIHDRFQFLVDFCQAAVFQSVRRHDGEKAKGEDEQTQAENTGSHQQTAQRVEPALRAIRNHKADGAPSDKEKPN